MSAQRPPITCRDFKTILRKLGFTHRNSQGSHESWVREVPPPFRKVTVDCPKAPFSGPLIDFMCIQAGISKNELFKLYFAL